MENVLKISEAASLGLHTMAYLSANRGRRISTHEIAQALNASETHLSKVLQRLVKAGFVTSIRGPGGGFALDDGKEDLSLLHVYEAIEGRLAPARCLLSRPICGGHCILGGLVGDLNKKVRDYLARTRLSDLGDTFRRRDHGGKKDHHD